jgi:hypothetical protein
MAALVFLHQDMKKVNFDLYERAANERMELFEERDKLILRLMETRADAVTAAMTQLNQQSIRLAQVAAALDNRSQEHREQEELLRKILERLPSPPPEKNP